MEGLLSVVIFVVIVIIAKGKNANKENKNQKAKKASDFVAMRIEQAMTQTAAHARTEGAQDAYASGEDEHLEAEGASYDTAQVWSANGYAEKTHKKFSDAVEKSFRDDLHGDWLAKQLREEARIKSQTDLGAVHDASCEAREIKMAHAKAHAAGKIR